VILEGILYVPNVLLTACPGLTIVALSVLNAAAYGTHPEYAVLARLTDFDFKREKIYEFYTTTTRQPKAKALGATLSI
jgi:hypothetical protein